MGRQKNSNNFSFIDYLCAQLVDSKLFVLVLYPLTQTSLATDIFQASINQPINDGQIRSNFPLYIQVCMILTARRIIFLARIPLNVLLRVVDDVTLQQDANRLRNIRGIYEMIFFLGYFLIRITFLKLWQGAQAAIQE